MDVPKYEVRVMKKEDISQALQMLKKVPINGSIHLLHTWIEVDPLGFHVAITDSGEILGICAAIFNNDDLVFVGLNVVGEKYRGKGIGLAIWKACTNHIGDKNVALTANSKHLSMYRDKGGFKIVETEWKICVHFTDQPVDPSVLLAEAPGIKIRRVEEADLPMILDYDSKLIGYKRKVIISMTLKEKNSQSFVAVENGECVGYGNITCQGWGMIGPLYSDSTEVAEVLLRNLISSLPNGKGICIVKVSCNLGAKAIIDKLNIPLLRESSRLYLKRKIEVPDLNKVFGCLNVSFAPF